MITIKIFQFNPFQENTYVLYDETHECVVIDPGCYSVKEKEQLTNFISSKNLKPVKVINTHGHIDHILGIAFVSAKYNIDYYLHRGDSILLNNSSDIGVNFGMNFEKPAKLPVFVEEGNEIKFGNSVLEVIYTPGHSQGGICFYCRKDNFLISGDTLFDNSIGRTDLFGGNYDTLISSIKSKLFVLPDDCKVYPGHGPETSIASEKKDNPFFK
ncbi:MAG: MBL fold metallo-hydrolase [Bacteroidota bacterium]|nr:MBL fold metallo-hydrolase [Bacteroidota bacterium]